MTGRRCRGGHIYVEMLVVIFIIISLMSMLLPAVNAAREASRRNACAGNLSQLILAIQQYDFSHTSFPSGVINDTGPIRSLPAGYHHNWIVQILPFLDERSLSAKIDRGVSVYDPRNNLARSTSLPVLHCPSDDGGKGPFSNYAGVHNDAEAPIDVTNTGVLFLNSGIRYEDMRDGSAHTAVLGEKTIDPGDLGWMSGTRATLRNAGLPILGAGALGNPAGDQAGDGRTRWDKFWKEIDERGGAEVPSGPGAKDESLQVGGFSSKHAGVTMSAHADGSVRYIGISAQTAHRADGQMTE